MTWRKILAIFTIIFFLLMLFVYLIFGTSEYSNAINQAVINYDLNGCENLPSYKFMLESHPGMIGSSYSIENQRENCFHETANHFLISESSLPVFLEAAKTNNPSICPNDPNFMCLRTIMKKYQEPNVCQYFFMESDDIYWSYGYVFRCHGYLVALGKQNVSYCQQLNQDLVNSCYWSLASEYNRIRMFTPSDLVVHQTSEGKSYYLPKPEIPNICGEVQDTSIKDNCKAIFTKFESWETPTLD